MTIVSIIMPCYNASRFIGEAIQSVQSQSFVDWELLVVDDGSMDESVSVVQKYAQNDTRIKLIRQPNSGACRARNNGIEKAQGKFIKFLDADDLLEQECLATQVKQISQLGYRQIPFGDYYNVDENGKVISTYCFNKSEELAKDQVYFFFSEWRILITAPLHRTALLREICGFNESLRRGQESDMHLRLALADVEFIYMPCMTFSYRDNHAPTRISQNYQEGTPALRQYRIQRSHICEQLFLKKYGKIPTKYNQFFSDSWFSVARENFANGNVEQGLQYLIKARQYGLHTCFQRTYDWVGAIFGYKQIENILQLRLRIMRKNQ